MSGSAPARAALLSLALGLAGCREPPREAPAPSLLPDEAGPLDALSRRHARLRQRLRTRGYDTQVGLSRLFLLEQEGRALPLDLTVGRCSTFVALAGTAIRELVLVLYDGLGEEVAVDAVPGEGGLVHVCPQADGKAEVRPYHLVLRALEGSGVLLVAHIESAPLVGEGFDGLFEGVLAPRVAFREVEEQLAESRTALRARGFSVVEGPHLERLAEGGTLRRTLALDADHCYVGLGRGGSGLADIDLFLFDGAGVEVARDLGSDAEPSLEHCPAAAGRYTLELRSFEGAGAVGLVLLSGPRPEHGTEDVSALEGESAAATEGADPGVALDVLAAPLSDRGFDPPVFVARDAAITPGEVRTHELVIGPGCAILAGAASSSAMDLDLYLVDPSGRELDRDTAVQSSARVRACRDQPTVVRAAVKGYGRSGTYALALLRAPETVRSLRSLLLEEGTAPFRLQAFDERKTLSAELEEGGSFRHALALEEGTCIAVAAAGDASVRDVDLFLRGVDEALLASESGPAPLAVVSRCAEGRETWVVETVLFRGRGTVSLVILEEGEPGEEDGASAGGSGEAARVRGRPAGGQPRGAEGSARVTAPSGAPASSP